ncbi:molybdopterin-guanine dinucleotide biosynthesis protein A [Streptomyces sp. 846.5]|nr:molybdopterin-guanine dinucleotide biosynthesis protein A [Streptomyces sp. 846.5]
MDGEPGTYDAVVLAGGTARRFGGATDKVALEVDGTALLDRVLAGCAGARATVVVGPRRPTRRPVSWVREQPPGGGPVAAVAAALPSVTADRILLLAADLPFFEPATAALLLRELDGEPGVAVAVLVDADGRDQPLAAAYRTAPLLAALAALGDPAGLPLRRLVGGLTTRRIADADGAALDCDTWDDLARARAHARSRAPREM